MSAARKRKEAAARLGLEFHKRYERLALAVGEDEISMRAVELGETFNTNLEFVIWVLKEYGGIQQVPFAPIRKTHHEKQMAVSSKG